VLDHASVTVPPEATLRGVPCRVMVGALAGGAGATAMALRACCIRTGWLRNEVDVIVAPVAGNVNCRRYISSRRVKYR